MWAFWRFSPDMPRVRGGFPDCDCHPTDHDRFLRYTWLMDIRICAVLEDHHAEVLKHPLGAASTGDQANDAHTALAAGYRDWSNARRAGWAQGQPSDGISLQDIPDEAVIGQNAS